MYDIAGRFCWSSSLHCLTSWTRSGCWICSTIASRESGSWNSCVKSSTSSTSKLNVHLCWLRGFRCIICKVKGQRYICAQLRISAHVQFSTVNCTCVLIAMLWNLEPRPSVQNPPEAVVVDDKWRYFTAWPYWLAVVDCSNSWLDYSSMSWIQHSKNLWSSATET